MSTALKRTTKRNYESPYSYYNIEMLERIFGYETTGQESKEIAGRMAEKVERP
jgi:hypothetical protein